MRQTESRLTQQVPHSLLNTFFTSFAYLFHLLNPLGNVYIADFFNYRVRKVTVSTGIITTFAGNGTQSYSGDGGAATAATLNSLQGVGLDATGNVYIGDTYNHRVRKVTVSTGIITTIAGTGTPSYSGDNGPATSAELFGPHGVALDSLGTHSLTHSLIYRYYSCCNYNNSLFSLPR